MANLMVRLLLNDSDFNNKIGKSKKQLQSYQNIGKQAFGGMVTALKGFAGAAGVAFTAVEGFKKVIGSSQTLTDAYGRSLEMLKTGFDNLVYAMASADFSSFNSGLAESTAKAKELYNAVDALANINMAAGALVKYNEIKYKRLEVIADDKSKPMAEREAALRQMEKLAGESDTASRLVGEAALKALTAKYASRSDLRFADITADDLSNVLFVDAKVNSEAVRAQAAEKYEEYLRVLDEAKIKAKKEAQSLKLPFAYKGSKEARENIKKREAYEDSRYATYSREAAIKYKDAILKTVAFEVQKDEELQKDFNLLILEAEKSNNAQEKLKAVTAKWASLRSETATNVKGLAASPSADALFPYGLPTVPGGDMGASLTKTIESRQMKHSSGDMSANLPKTIDARQMKHSSVDDMIARGKTEAMIFESDIKQMELAAQRADNLAAAFSRVGDTIGGAAGNMLNFTAGIAEAVSQVLPFITLLWAEEQAHNANASAATKEAAAKVMASYAGIPFAGVALGAAAVASIIGIMQSIPALAKGGVVDSPTLAMIGEAGPEAVVPLDRLNDFGNSQFREVRVHGEIKASGKDLVVTIDNYNKVRKVK